MIENIDYEFKFSLDCGSKELASTVGNLFQRFSLLESDDYVPIGFRFKGEETHSLLGIVDEIKEDVKEVYCNIRELRFTGEPTQDIFNVSTTLGNPSDLSNFGLSCISTGKLFTLCGTLSTKLDIVIDKVKGFLSEKETKLILNKNGFSEYTPICASGAKILEVTFGVTEDGRADFLVKSKEQDFSFEDWKNQIIKYIYSLTV